MVRVLITGGRGGLGQALQARLSLPGVTLAPSWPGAVEVVALGRDALDIAKRESVARALTEHKPDIVLNTAGFTHVDLAETHQWEAFLANRDGAEHVARESARIGAMPVYFSTDLIFDGAKKTPYTEEDPPNPLCVYGDTKLAGELSIMSHAPKHLIVRTGWLYAHSGKHFLRAVQDGLTPNELLFGYEDQIAQPTHVNDFADGLIAALARGLTGTLHIANGGQATQFEALRQCVQLLGKRDIEVRPIRHSIGGRQAMRPSFSVLDCTKLEGAGHRMRPWQEGMAVFLQQVARRFDTHDHVSSTAKTQRLPSP
jgi:dTDP-4-dehydrorhamnose reductase